MIIFISQMWNSFKIMVYKNNILLKHSIESQAKPYDTQLLAQHKKSDHILMCSYYFCINNLIINVIRRQHKLPKNISF